MSEPRDLGPFLLGINTIDDPKAEVFQPPSQGKPQPGALLAGDNVDQLRAGVLRRREGLTEVRALTSGHSGVALRDRAFYVDNGTLYEFDPDASSDVALVTGLGADFVSLTEAAGSIYGSQSDTKVFRIIGTTAGHWGVPIADPPVLSETTGTLRAGTYQVALQPVTVSGVEGGVWEAASITLTAPGAIVIAAMAFDPIVTHVNVWCSDSDGPDLFFVGSYLAGDALTISTVEQSDERFDDFLVFPPPPGHIVRYWQGRLIVATDLPDYGTALYFSEPNGYHRFRLGDDMQMLAARPVVLEPVSDGFYCALEDGPTYFYSGTDPRNLTRTQVDTLPALEGSMTLPARMIPQLQSPMDTLVAVWACSDGFVVGMPGGLTRHLTRGQVAFDANTRAALTYREAAGLRQLMLSASQLKQPNAVAFGDLPIWSITRGGVPL